MTKQECAIIMAHTGVCMLTGNEFSEYHKYIEYIMNRPVWTHELADKSIVEEIESKSKEDFLNLCKEAKTDGWIKCSERLPQEGKSVLVYYQDMMATEPTGRYCLMTRNLINELNAECIKVIAWYDYPRFEGEIQPEEELPFK